MLLATAVCLLAACVAVYVVQALVEHNRLRRVINKIPGWNGLPVIGDSLKIPGDPHGWFHALVRLCKENYDSGIMKIWIGSTPALFVYRADTMEEIHKNPKHISKDWTYGLMKPWLGEGLITRSDSKWFARRRLITPTFHFKILEQFSHVFNEQAAVLVSQLDQKAGGPGFDIQPYIYRCMLDVICETAMGVKIDAQHSSDSDYVRAVHRESELIFYRMLCPWLWPPLLYKLSPSGRDESRNLDIIHRFTRQVITNRQKEIERDVVSKGTSTSTTAASTSNGDSTSGNDDDSCIYTSTKRRRLAFLDMLLEAAREDTTLTVDDIQEEVHTFMVAGHDPTASAMIWIIYMLACHPELQVKVQQEIDAVLGDSFHDVTMKDVHQLKYTDCFIRETLRLYPPVSLYARETGEDCVIGGYQVPAGSSVSILPYVLHRDPAYFPDPEKFDPDRWLDDSLTSRHPYCYVPFSAGLRNCIGQKFAMLEKKVVLCHLMRNFTMSTDSCQQDIDIVLTITLRPVVPFMLRLERRINCRED